MKIKMIVIILFLSIFVIVRILKDANILSTKGKPFFSTRGKSGIKHFVIYDLVERSKYQEHRTNCTCQGFANRTAWKCPPDERLEDTIIHCIENNGIGYFRILANCLYSHVAAFVRLNGPMVDTSHFEPEETGNCSAWFTNYSLCRPGNYTAAVYIYLRDQDVESVLRNQSCLDRLFQSPALFSWSLPAPAALRCSGLWLWAGPATRSSAELSLYRSPARRDYAKAYRGLFPDGLRPFPERRAGAWTAAAADGRPACLYGDSQTRNLVNSLAARLDPAACKPQARPGPPSAAQRGGIRESVPNGVSGLQISFLTWNRPEFPRAAGTLEDALDFRKAPTPRPPRRRAPAPGRRTRRSRPRARCRASGSRPSATPPSGPAAARRAPPGSSATAPARWSTWASGPPAGRRPPGRTASRSTGRWASETPPPPTLPRGALARPARGCDPIPALPLGRGEAPLP